MTTVEHGWAGARKRIRNSLKEAVSTDHCRTQNEENEHVKLIYIGTNVHGGNNSSRRRPSSVGSAQTIVERQTLVCIREFHDPLLSTNAQNLRLSTLQSIEQTQHSPGHKMI
jgi:hypothetical protein